MIQMFFGLPGSGKSSLLAYFAQRENKKIIKGKSKYRAVYSNFYISGCYQLKYSDLGKYYLHDCLILLDELTLEQDSREWKTESKDLKEFIVLHRHFKVDIIVALQDFSRCPKTIRNCVTSLYYLDYWGFGFARTRRIYRTITINEYIGELIMGYRFREGFYEFLEDLKGFYYVKKAWGLYDTHDLMGFDKKPEYFMILWGSEQLPAVVREPQPLAAPDVPDLIVDKNNKRR